MTRKIPTIATLLTLSAAPVLAEETGPSAEPAKTTRAIQIAPPEQLDIANHVKLWVLLDENGNQVLIEDEAQARAFFDQAKPEVVCFKMGPDGTLTMSSRTDNGKTVFAPDVGPAEVPDLDALRAVEDAQERALAAERTRADAMALPARIEAAFLGVNAQPLDFDTAKRLNMPRGTGLTVGFVQPDGPAAEAGLKKDDILTKLNDQVLVNAEQFAVLIRTYKPGDTVTLHGLREGKPIKLEAELIEANVRPLGPGGSNLTQRWRVQQRPEMQLEPFDRPGQLQVIPQLDDRMPEELREMMRQMRKRMQHQQEQIEQRMQQMRLELDLDLDELREQLEPLPGKIGGEHRVQASMMVADGEHTLQLKTTDGHKHLTIKTADGEVLFDGELPEGGQIDGLDPDVQRKLDNMLKNNRIEFRPGPAEPAPKPEQPKPVA